MPGSVETPLSAGEVQYGPAPHVDGRKCDVGISLPSPTLLLQRDQKKVNRQGGSPQLLPPRAAASHVTLLFFLAAFLGVSFQMGKQLFKPLGLLGGRCLPWLQLTRRSRHKVQGLHWVQEWSSYGCKAQGCNLFNRLHFNQSSVLFSNSQYDLECLLWYKVGFGKVFKTLSYIHMVIMLLLELREVGMIWTSNIMIFLIRTVEMTLSCYRMVPNTVNMKL